MTSCASICLSQTSLLVLCNVWKEWRTERDAGSSEGVCLLRALPAPPSLWEDSPLFSFLEPFTFTTVPGHTVLYFLYCCSTEVINALLDNYFWLNILLKQHIYTTQMYTSMSWCYMCMCVFVCVERDVYVYIFSPLWKYLD